MSKTMFQPATVHKATTYTHAVRKGHTIHISGQVAKDVDGTLVGPGDIAAQSEQVFKNLKLVTESAGATLRDIVKITIYTTNLAYRPAIADVRAKYFDPEYPASTFLVITSLAEPGFLLEVEAVAIAG